MRPAHVLIALIALTAVLRTAAAAPKKCPVGEKPFKCHALAMSAHLGVGGAVDLATAMALYADACAQRQPASCNNLAVLALLHPELGKDVDPKALFDTACGRMENAACDNARRLASHKELAVKLAFGGSELTEGADRFHELERGACKAGDVFRCEDAGSRASVSSVLADECRSSRPATCFDAAAHATDDATIATLLGLGCTAHDGRACHSLATRKAAGGAKDEALIDQWRGACSDKDFSITDEDIASRIEACKRWGMATRKRADQLGAAVVVAEYCTARQAGACAAAEQVYDHAGDHAKAFAIVKSLCWDEHTECLDLGERYVVGNGVTADLAQALTAFGGTCPHGLAWATCKRIGAYLVGKHQALDAVAAYKTYCDGGIVEACYLSARAIEAEPTYATCGPKPTISELKLTYDDLCAKKYQDSCRRSAGMCARAMNDFVDPHPRPDECGGAIGDGNIQLGQRYHSVVDLCPATVWTPAVRKMMNDIDKSCRYYEGGGGSCDR